MIRYIYLYQIPNEMEQKHCLTFSLLSIFMPFLVYHISCSISERPGLNANNAHYCAHLCRCSLLKDLCYLGAACSNDVLKYRCSKQTKSFVRSILNCSKRVSVLVHYFEDLTTNKTHSEILLPLQAPKCVVATWVKKFSSALHYFSRLSQAWVSKVQNENLKLSRIRT